MGCITYFGKNDEPRAALAIRAYEEIKRAVEELGGDVYGSDDIIEIRFDEDVVSIDIAARFDIDVLAKKISRQGQRESVTP